MMETEANPTPVAADSVPTETPASEPAAPAAMIAEEPALSEAPPPTGTHLGTGRRKTAVARVRLFPGSGNFQINGRSVEEFFTEPQDRNDAVAPLELTGIRRHWDVKVNVHGGGHTGQAGAVRLGVSRALVKAYSNHEATLRDAGFLTRDAREVERKKPGQRKARRRFQFSKR